MLHRWSTKLSASLATITSFLALIPGVVASPGNPPIVDYVTVGGSQSPSSSVTRTYEDVAPGCKAQARVYVRWYVTQVNGSQVFVDRIYYTFRPNVSGEWYGYRLWDGNRVNALTAAPGGTIGGITAVPANTRISGYYEVKKWINWGRNRYISFEPEYSTTRTPSNTSVGCGKRTEDIFALQLR